MAAKSEKPAKAKTPKEPRDEKALKPPKGWKQWSDRDAIWKTYKFKDFIEAFSFMTSSALVAQSMDHHPEWSNIYNKVEVTLTTHDAGGVTEKDIILAKAMDRLAGKAG
jgi:4a-hydroxytetrahydrobiopterin dehydratase